MDADSTSGGGRYWGGMGYNPHRRFKARPFDYVMVAAAMLTAAALVAWGLFS